MAVRPEWGLVDVVRRFHPESGYFTWWDYRAGHFHKNIGMRIDHVYVTHPLAARATAARRNLARMRAGPAGDAQPIREWEILLERPLPALLPVLTDASPWARELRHMTPFAGVLAVAERAAVYQAFQLAERALGR